MISKYNILTILFVLFCSCSKNSNYSYEVLSQKDAQILADKMVNNSFLGSSFTMFNVYFLDSKDNVLKVRTDYLLQFYDLGHIDNYKSYSDYIYSVFNQRLFDKDSSTIRSMDFCCKKDRDVYNLYKRKKIEGIISKYCVYDKTYKYYQLNKHVTNCEKETISYLFFINRYIKRESDVIWRVIFYPFPVDFNKI